ncbi:MAG: class I SAM-dependent methyltransferase [Phycisphaerae bacterium]
MRFRPSPANPHTALRFAYAWEHIPPDTASHLDVGCYDGEFLAGLTSRGIGRLVGADASSTAIAKARRAHPQCEFVHLSPPEGDLPFADESFTSVSLLEVIEHVADQKHLLGEVHRVLAPGGLLLVSVPGKHLFSFLDVGNLKFRFPHLHRWFYVRKHGREEYLRRYVDNPEGLVGDISMKKRWHEHFRSDGLKQLLRSSGFEVLDIDGAGFFWRLILGSRIALNQLRFVPGSQALTAVLAKAYQWDNSLGSVANLFCLARKPAEATGKEPPR